MFKNRGNRKNSYLQIMADITSMITEAAQLFRENVENLEEREKYSKKIKLLESKGDEYTQLLIKQLNKEYFAPMDREDIFHLVTNLDDIMDGIEACAARCVFIDKSTPSLIKFADILVEICKYLQDAFTSLNNREFEALHRIIIEINSLETEADVLLRETLSSLFADPQDVVSLIKMKDIYERLEKTTDAAEDIADVFESMIIKYA
ncbi:DUF47 family protein [Thermoactinomyces sp. AMNI-1]|uniref:DUF47 family protein n=1 Tax=Thermoactinomyces mirandus TaxID=2756294 RepID=A0A7W2ART5_9BACL|nr:DUF47 family protein [Thermoactinomyces mirandus]